MSSKLLHDMEDPKKKKDESSKGKIIALIIIVLLALFITFLVLYLEELNKDRTIIKSEIQVCMNASCITAAASLVNNMNRKVNPCDNFYEFACGNWNKTEVIPDSNTRWGVFDILRRQLLRDLRGTLTVADISALPLDTMNSTYKIQRYFHSCMETEQIAKEMRELEPMKNFFLEEMDFPLENWPATRDFVATDPQRLKNTIMLARKYGNSLGIFNNGLTPNISEPKQNVIEFEAGRFTLDRSILVNASKAREHKAYVDFMVEVAVLIQRRLGNENANDELYRPIFEDVLKFEKALANYTLPPEKRRNEREHWHEMTLNDFAETYFNPANGSEPLALHIYGKEWVKYFQTAWGHQSTEGLTDNTLVVVREPAYYGNVTRALRGIEFQYRFFWNYVGWKVVEPFVRHIDDEFLAIYQRFRKVTAGTSASTPRPEVCVDTVTNHFPNAVGSLYVKNFFQPQAKKDLETMAEHLMWAFREIVKESHWMTEATRVRALEKANMFTSLIAYDEYLMSDDPTALNLEHESFRPNNTYFYNYVKGRNFETQVEGKMLVKGNNASDWITGPAIVNAFYSPNHNSISFPAGILQAPFLGQGYPWYWNFAAIGTVIGHEITHGFDDQGAQSDGAGYFDDWWDEASKAAFNRRAQTIIDQYSGYSLMGVQLKGENNQGENIADNGGIKESYRGYKHFLKNVLEVDEEPRLPGFENFSTDQMFFLSYAQMWCGDYRLEELQLQVNRPHSPGRFRIIGPLQNSPEFSQAYRCAPDTYMNPAAKAAVW
ncbi:hypothetical protein RvY_01697 [Ramazzottius varieornatus]|uniref:Peptidase M13 N-terminal domain-containing protein n=1 Tax=Ramazzottius varieornatus TaxID=947166 RepID=A0A1D1UHF1_RAMVA|nr:hypothetical protein RvY_01697 [Ramazzottius varieornatus]